MSPKASLWIGTVALLLVSLLAAFFVVFNSVFSDVFGAEERFGTFVYAAVSYFILGLIAGTSGPTHARRWVWILSVPAILILALYTLSERQNALIHLAFALIVPAASHAGAITGRRLRAVMKKETP